MTNEELNEWERSPFVMNILTSKEFGAWLHRRDKNKEKQGRKENKNMSEIELVIKIPEDSYKALCNGHMLPPDVENVVQGIKNGTPLPKGHGRLGDLDELNNGLREQQKSYEHTFGIRRPINEAVRDGIAISIYRIDDAPTIIEAEEVENDRE